jgi:Putative zinc-finger
MSCEPIRLALSAMLDGEPADVDPVDIELHLESCAACRVWREAAHEVTRRARLAPATDPRPGRDALDRILASAPRTRVNRDATLRGALVVVALAQLIITLPLLLLGTHDLQRDMGASDMAVCVAFLVVAWRPGRAVAISPVVGTAACLLLIAALTDLAQGDARLIGEAPHVVALIGWLLVREVAVSTPPTIEVTDRPLSRRLRRAVQHRAQNADGITALRGSLPRRNSVIQQPVVRYDGPATADHALEREPAPAEEHGSAQRRASA